MITISDRMTHLAVLAAMAGFLAILWIGGAALMFSAIGMLSEAAGRGVEVIQGVATFLSGLAMAAIASFSSVVIPVSAIRNRLDRGLR